MPRALAIVMSGEGIVLHPTPTQEEEDEDKAGASEEGVRQLFLGLHSKEETSGDLLTHWVHAPSCTAPHPQTLTPQVRNHQTHHHDHYDKAMTKGTHSAKAEAGSSRYVCVHCIAPKFLFD